MLNSRLLLVLSLICHPLTADAPSFSKTVIKGVLFNMSYNQVKSSLPKKQLQKKRMRKKHLIVQKRLFEKVPMFSYFYFAENELRLVELSTKNPSSTYSAYNKYSEFEYVRKVIQNQRKKEVPEYSDTSHVCYQSDLTITYKWSGIDLLFKSSCPRNRDLKFDQYKLDLTGEIIIRNYIDSYEEDKLKYEVDLKSKDAVIGKQFTKKEFHDFFKQKQALLEYEKYKKIDKNTYIDVEFLTAWIYQGESRYGRVDVLRNVYLRDLNLPLLFRDIKLQSDFIRNNNLRCKKGKSISFTRSAKRYNVSIRHNCATLIGNGYVITSETTHASNLRKYLKYLKQIKNNGK